MTVYSHSRLSTYENCPLQYKLQYIDRLTTGVEGIEAFLGNCVHDTLKKCYDDARLTKVCSPDELVACFDMLWEKNWHDDIVIAHEEMTADHYRNHGRNMLRTYYARYAPFCSDTTIDTELNINFPLDEKGEYRITGFIDRLARDADGTIWIHDYKTGGSLTTQASADADRQLALYQIGVQKRWPHIDKVRLVWHYLAFDQDIVSTRTPEALTEVAARTTRLIDEIEAATDFPPRESPLCGWCDFPEHCPNHKHLKMVEALPPDKYASEPGVALVNRYAELKQQANALDAEMEQVKEAIINYSKTNGMLVIRGDRHLARIRTDHRLKFPAKSDPDRAELDAILIEAGKWQEISQLDATALGKVVQGGGWDKGLRDKVMRFGRMEESCFVYIARLKEEEE